MLDDYSTTQNGKDLGGIHDYNQQVEKKMEIQIRQQSISSLFLSK